MTSLTRPDATSEQYLYDAAGRQRARVRPSGNRTTIIHDNMGGVIQVQPAAPDSLINQLWDSRSRRILLDDGTGKTGFGYGARTPVTKKTQE